MPGPAPSPNPSFSGPESPVRGLSGPSRAGSQAPVKVRATISYALMVAPEEPEGSLLLETMLAWREAVRHVVFQSLSRVPEGTITSLTLHKEWPFNPFLGCQIIFY